MLLKLLRYWLPTALCIAGVVVIVVGRISEESLDIGIPLFSAGSSIWLLNLLHRVGVQGDRERGTEEDARAFFAEHGHWPDEPGPGSRA
ncbi:MAG: hypothetical protein QM679_05525 [Patulibacter sp.]